MLQRHLTIRGFRTLMNQYHLEISMMDAALSVSLGENSHWYYPPLHINDVAADLSHAKQRSLPRATQVSLGGRSSISNSIFFVLSFFM